MSVYLKPRLAGLGKTLNQQGGGIGTRGPGETKLETDSRLIVKRINKLKKGLKARQELLTYFQKKAETVDTEKKTLFSELVNKSLTKTLFSNENFSK